MIEIFLRRGIVIDVVDVILARFHNSYVCREQFGTFYYICVYTCVEKCVNLRVGTAKMKRIFFKTKQFEENNYQYGIKR